MENILGVSSLSKTYHSGHGSLSVLKNINFQLQSGKTLAIVGPSGSGKTTLLGLCAGLDTASEGEVMLNGIMLNNQSQDQLALIRNQLVGFIFQNFQLISTLTALENVMVPLELQRKKNAADVAKKLLDRVGLGARVDHYPSQLSGGEQQRVAIARAFSNNPKILFADEPTGNLDGETSHAVENLLFEVNKELNTTLVIVTHDMELAAKTDQIIRLKNGEMV
jgi:putative ABC transport system ATP-binding protein